jgi:ATP-dependent helicase HrpA
LQKDLRGLSKLSPLLGGFGTLEDVQAAAFEMLKRYLLPKEAFPALRQAAFTAAGYRARSLFPGLATQCIDKLETPLKLRAETLRRLGTATARSPVIPRARTLTDLSQLGARPAPPAAVKPSPLLAELEVLLPRTLSIPFERLPDITRYLKALLTRVERAALNPVKDQERARQLQPYAEALQKIQNGERRPAGRQLIEQLRWMVEEYKVSLFAQELGTAVPVSPKRLDELIRLIKEQ